MPHKHNPYAERWALRREFEVGHLLLEEKEIEPFLEETLGGLGRRPPEIRLKEGARVARFLRRLALEGVPKQQPDTPLSGNQQRDQEQVSEHHQLRLHELGETIWNILLQNAPIEPAKPTAAIRFLKRYESTFLTHHRVPEALNTIQALGLPAESKDTFSPPNLVAPTITSTGEGNPRLSDDLSERIYVTYFALRRQKKRGVGKEIANVLERLQIGRIRSKEGVWTYEVVQDRIKQYKRRKSRELSEGSAKDRKEALDRWSEHLADISIGAFRGVRKIEEDRKKAEQEADGQP